MENMFRKRLDLLREMMAEKGIDAWLVPTTDYHASEYVGDYFKCRAFLTGFTGSAGTAVVTAGKAGLWTDGRYYIQAARELKGSGFALYRAGEPGVISIREFLRKNLPRGGVLGFDGRTVSAAEGQALEAALSDRGAAVRTDLDLVGEMWQDRPAMPEEKVFILPEKYAGESAASRIKRLREEMAGLRATAHILTTLDDIAWLLNLRGNDILYTPFFLANAIVTAGRFWLFADKKKFGREELAYLGGLGVELLPYEEFWQMASSLRNERILLEKSQVSISLWNRVCGENRLIDRMNPVSLWKAVKNETEMANLRKAHLKDAAAMIRFLRWFDENVGSGKLTETMAEQKLDDLRKEQEGCLGPSFKTISAWGENGAVVHYSAEPGKDKVIEPRGLYLVDSGGQYREGTTDITRTVACGPVSEEEKRAWTLVTAGMLRLQALHFPAGCRGVNLDLAARELLWRNGLDFNHGTGHGVGYFGGVHERPVGIRTRLLSRPEENSVFLPGMVCSDEPGVYIEGKYGIRSENLLLCREAEKTSHGQFFSFEPLTMVPLDRRLFCPEAAEERDLLLFNEYNRMVRDTMLPLLSGEDAKWLILATAEYE